MSMKIVLYVVLLSSSVHADVALNKAELEQLRLLSKAESKARAQYQKTIVEVDLDIQRAHDDAWAAENREVAAHDRAVDAWKALVHYVEHDLADHYSVGLSTVVATGKLPEPRLMPIVEMPREPARTSSRVYRWPFSEQCFGTNLTVPPWGR